jgi:hypothetical protein
MTTPVARGRYGRGDHHGHQPDGMGAGTGVGFGSGGRRRGGPRGAAGGDEAAAGVVWGVSTPAAGTYAGGGAVGDTDLTGVDDGVTDGASGVTDGGTEGVERAGAVGPGVVVAAALCPVSVTASAIAVPTAASAPAPAAAPDRKLISSMRA